MARERSRRYIRLVFLPRNLLVSRFVCWAGVGAALCAASAAASPQLNLPQTFADTKAKLGEGGSANILVIGDSFSYEYESRWSSWATPFRGSMQSEYGGSSHGYMPILTSGQSIPSGWTGHNVFGAIQFPLMGMNDVWIRSTSPAPAYLQPCDHRLDLHYQLLPGGGTFQVFDESAPAPRLIDTLSTASTGYGVASVHIEIDAGLTPKLRLQPVDSTPVTILGYNALGQAGAPGVRLHTISNGWGVAQYAMTAASFEDQTRLFEPDLVIVWLGQNDILDWFRRQPLINTLVDRIQAAAPEAEIMMIGTPDSNWPNVPDAVRAYEMVARDRGLGFLNLYEIAGSYEFLFSSGYTAPDDKHHSAAGAKYLADIIYKAFVTDGASVAPEPSSSLIAALACLCWRRRGK